MSSEIIDENVLIIDDFLPEKLAEEIEMELLDRAFPWFWVPATCDVESSGVHTCEGLLMEDSFQFTHGFFRDNEVESDRANLPMELFHRVVGKLDVGKVMLFRLKSNLNVRESENTRVLLPHYDITNMLRNDETGKLLNDFISFIYYVNDSDGDTFVYIENEFDKNLTIKETISPKKNRLVVFNSRSIHAGSTPVINDRRIIINGIIKCKDLLSNNIIKHKTID